MILKLTPNLNTNPDSNPNRSRNPKPLTVLTITVMTRCSATDRTVILKHAGTADAGAGDDYVLITGRRDTGTLPEIQFFCLITV